MRDLCQAEIRQMRHCRQCRADAVGLLSDDRSAEFRQCAKPLPAEPPSVATTYRIAVTSKHGKLVDQHFGHASDFLIYQVAGDTCTLLETRQLAKYCAGPADCDSAEDGKEAIAQALGDCEAVLTMRIGQHAAARLSRHGITAVESCYTVEHGLKQAAQQLQQSKA